MEYFLLILGGVLIGFAFGALVSQHAIKRLSGELMVAESKMREIDRAAAAAHHAVFGGVGMGEATVNLLWNNLWELLGLAKKGRPR